MVREECGAGERVQTSGAKGLISGRCGVLGAACRRRTAAELPL